MQNARTFVMLAALSALLIVVGTIVGGAVGGKSWAKYGAIIAFLVSLGINFYSYWYSAEAVLNAYNAQPISYEDDPRLYQMVQQLAQNADLPTPRLYYIPDPSPNAFATGRDPEHGVVAVTDGILKLLSYEELAGVISHELGHIKNRDILVQSVAATMGMTITFIAQLAYFIPMGSRDNREGSGNPIVFLLMLVLAPIASALIQMTISRSREYFADEAGAQICGRPAWLARALEKLAHGVAETPLHGNPATSHMFIVKPFSGGISGLFSTHPPIEERIMRLREMAGLAQ